MTAVWRQECPIKYDMAFAGYADYCFTTRVVIQLSVLCLSSTLRCGLIVTHYVRFVSFYLFIIHKTCMISNVD